jgi:hypothetical protein
MNAGPLSGLSLSVMRKTLFCPFRVVPLIIRRNVSEAGFRENINGFKVSPSRVSEDMIAAFEDVGDVEFLFWLAGWELLRNHTWLIAGRFSRVNLILCFCEAWSR